MFSRNILNGEIIVAAIVTEAAEEVRRSKADKSAAEENEADLNTRRGKV